MARRGVPPKGSGGQLLQDLWNEAFSDRQTLLKLVSDRGADEGIVLRVARARTAPRAVLMAMAKNPRLMASYQICLELAQNPKTPREVFHGRELRAFLSSCCAVILLLALFGVEMYPNLITSTRAPEHSLHICNAASSGKTLGIMLVIAALGVPLVLAYTVSIYWICRGKVKLDSSSY